MSPTPFPTIFGGLAQGIYAGQKVGLMQEEMKLRKEEVAQKREEYSFEKNFKLVKMDLDKIDSIQERLKDMPPEDRPGIWANVSVQTEIGKETISFNQNADDVTIKKISALRKELEFAMLRKDFDAVNRI